MLITTMSTTTGAGVLDSQMDVHQVPAQVFVRDKPQATVGLNARPRTRVSESMHGGDMLQHALDAGEPLLAFVTVKLDR